MNALPPFARTNRYARTVSQRFWEKVLKTESVSESAPHLGPCWLWLASKDASGYGLFRVCKSKTTRAHVYSFVEAGGVIPSKWEVDHLCRVRACVNPAHLEAVTSEENKRRSATVICRHGHPKEPGQRCEVCYKARRHEHYLATSEVKKALSREYHAAHRSTANARRLAAHYANRDEANRKRKERYELAKAARP